VFVPNVSGAFPAQEHDPGDDTDAGQIALDVDVARADQATLDQAFADLRNNVENERAQLAQAEQAVTDARAAHEAASAAVLATEQRIDDLVGQSDVIVTQAFISPPAESTMDALSAETATDATLKSSVLDMWTDADADVLTELQDARDQLEEQQAAEEDAAEATDQAVSDNELALEQLRGAVSQQTAFIEDVEGRVEHSLSELEGLRQTDPDLAAQLEARAQELSGQIGNAKLLAAEEAAFAAAGIEPPDDYYVEGSSTITLTASDLAVVSCPSGGSIQVAPSIARAVQNLLNLADNEGLPLCGNGWRDPAEQIALRRAHCGSSQYAIYQMPASSCRPPTARPGTSMHEQGLAIDFTCGSMGTVGWGDDCHDFLRAHARDYGLYPLSGEAWHWSINGD
jgi:hypothetical protein